MTDKPQGKDPGGQPTKYRAEYAEQAAKLCDLGATDIKLADFFNICEKTLYNWKAAHPEFLQALKVGKGVPDNNVERSLYHRAIGYSHLESKLNVVNGELVETMVEKHYPPDSTAMIFWLKNRRPGEYRDKVEQEITQPSALKIEITRAVKPDENCTN